MSEQGGTFSESYYILAKRVDFVYYIKICEQDGKLIRYKCDSAKI